MQNERKINSHHYLPMSNKLLDEQKSNDSNMASCDTKSTVHNFLDANNFGQSSESARRHSVKIEEELPDISYELQQAYKILKHIMSDSQKGTNCVFMTPMHYSTEVDYGDYHEVIKNPMWLKKIKDNLLSRKYCTITEFVADMRTLLENCYRYFGPDHVISKKGIKLEMMMEQKLVLLPREIREKTTLEATSKEILEKHTGNRRQSSRLGAGETSVLLSLLKHEKAAREKELRRRQMTEKKAEKEEKEKDVIEWEEKLLEEPLHSQMLTTWELPQIGHFLYLSQKPLNIPEVPQYELERILIMPRESSLLSTIMTSLLSSPNYRSQLDRKPSMPYRIWNEKLNVKVQSWYRFYQSKEGNSQAVFDRIGVEPAFFEVLGDTNPLETEMFHELTFHRKLWLVKSMCDYTLHNHKTIQDAINEQPIDDQRVYYLGEDNKGNVYLHFPQFCGQSLRIYRHAKLVYPKLNIPKSLKKIHHLTKQDPGKKTFIVKHNAKPASPVTTNHHTRPSRLRQVIKPVLKSPDEIKQETEVARVDDDPSSSAEDDEPTDDKKTFFIAHGTFADRSMYELVVDSVESLRDLIQSFESRKMEGMKNKNRNRKKNVFTRESQLCDNLENLLTELIPWEMKLQQAVRRLRNKLYKEWHDYQAKSNKDEEVEYDTWASDDETTGNEENVLEKFESAAATVSSDTVSSSEDDQPEFSYTRRSPGGVKILTPHGKKRKMPFVSHENSSTSTSSEDEASDVVESRLRSGRKTCLPVDGKDSESVLAKKKRPDDSKLPNGATKSLLMQHSKLNTASQAKELYAWETLRQILVSPKKEESTSSQQYMKTLNPTAAPSASEVVFSLSDASQQPTGNQIIVNPNLILKGHCAFEQLVKPQSKSLSNSKIISNHFSSNSVESGLQKHSSVTSLPLTLPTKGKATKNSVTSVLSNTIQRGDAARRQTRLAVGVPSVKQVELAPLTLYSVKQKHFPSKPAYVPPAMLVQTLKNPANCVQPVLTPASTTGTPKVLANVSSSNAQFMHFQLGSPSARKGGTVSLSPSNPSPITSMILPASNQETTLNQNQLQVVSSKSQQQLQPSVLFIPAIDQKGNTVYLKVVTSSSSPTATTNNAVNLSQAMAGKVLACGVKSSTVASFSNVSGKVPLETLFPTKTCRLLTSGSIVENYVMPSTSFDSASTLKECASDNMVMSPQSTVTVAAACPFITADIRQKGSEVGFFPKTSITTVTSSTQSTASFLLSSPCPPPLGPIRSGPKPLSIGTPVHNSLPENNQLSSNSSILSNSVQKFMLQPPPLAKIGNDGKGTLNSTSCSESGRGMPSYETKMHPTTPGPASNKIHNSNIVLQVPLVQSVNKKTSSGVTQVAAETKGETSVVLSHSTLPSRASSAQPFAQGSQPLVRLVTTSGSPITAVPTMAMLKMLPAKETSGGSTILQSPIHLLTTSGLAPRCSVTQVPQAFLVNSSGSSGLQLPLCNTALTAASEATTSALQSSTQLVVLKNCVGQADSKSNIQPSAQVQRLPTDSKVTLNKVEDTGAKSSFNIQQPGLPNIVSTRLVMLQDKNKSQALGFINKNGQIIPINTSSGQSGLVSLSSIQNTESRLINVTPSVDTRNLHTTSAELMLATGGVSSSANISSQGNSTLT